MTKETLQCKCCGKDLPLQMFRTSKLGRYQTCNECLRQNQIKAKLEKKLAKMTEKDVTEARSMRLKDFTPRELMAELKRRGYKFKMEYVETHVIDSKDIEI